jgi:hypothetical protein
VSKRVFLTLPDGIANDLERWAASEKNKAATLAGFLVEEAVRRAKEQGKIPPDDGSFPYYDTLAELVRDNRNKLAESEKFSSARLKALSGGDKPTEVEILRLALILGRTEEYVLSLKTNTDVSEGSAN